MRPEEKQGIFADNQEIGMRTGIDCPFCNLFIIEVGMLNVSDRDFEILSRHFWKEHSVFEN